MNMTRFEIRDALKMMDECFLCVFERNLEEKYAEHYLYEQVMDPQSRDAIVASRGFCNYHYYTLLRETRKPDGTDGQGMALIMESVNQALIDDVEVQRNSLIGAGEPKKSSSRISFFLCGARSRIFHPKEKKRLTFEKAAWQMLSLREACPACQHIDSFMKIYARALVDALNEVDQEIIGLFKTSKGLCIPHYATVICSIDEKVPESRKELVAQQIIEVQLKNMKRLNAEFSEYLRKQDYRFSNEPWGTEKDVIPRGVAKLAGMMGVRTISETN